MSSSRDEMEGETMGREVMEEVFEVVKDGGDRLDIGLSCLITASMYCSGILVNCHAAALHHYT